MPFMRAFYFAFIRLSSPYISFSHGFYALIVAFPQAFFAFFILFPRDSSRFLFFISICLSVRLSFRFRKPFMRFLFRFRAHFPRVYALICRFLPRPFLLFISARFSRCERTFANGARAPFNPHKKRRYCAFGIDCARIMWYNIYQGGGVYALSEK